MKTNELTCEMIQDLIPLCSEGLCSEDSKAAVEAHIQACEICRKLYSEIPQDAAPQKTTVPDEAKVFRKIGHQMKKNKILSGILLVLLAVLLGVTGWLSYGQIKKDYGRQSFETVFEAMRIKRLAKKMGSGDFQEYVQHMSTERYGTHWYTAGLDAEMTEQAESLLKEKFGQEFGDTKLKDVKVRTEYGLLFYGGTHSPMVSDAILSFDDGRYFTLSFVYGSDGGYICSGAETNADSEYKYAEERHIGKDGRMMNTLKNEFAEALNYLNDPDFYAPRGWMEQLFVTEMNGEGNRRNRADSIALRFSETCREQIYANVLAFQDAGFRFRRCVLSPMQFDREKKELYWDMTLEAEDGSGKAVLLTRFTRDLTGLVPQAAEQDTLYTDGCSDALAKALSGFFTE